MCLGSLGRVVKMWDEGGVPMAEVSSADRVINACLLYHPGVVEGDDVLVHMGFVVDVLDSQAAAQARELRSGLAGR